jgi:hypothetical protein
MAKEESPETILKKTFYACMVGTVLFCGAVILFVL